MQWKQDIPMDVSSMSHWKIIFWMKNDMVFHFFKNEFLVFDSFEFLANWYGSCYVEANEEKFHESLTRNVQKFIKGGTVVEFHPFELHLLQGNFC